MAEGLGSFHVGWTWTCLEIAAFDEWISENNTELGFGQPSCVSEQLTAETLSWASRLADAPRLRNSQTTTQRILEHSAQNPTGTRASGSGSHR